LPTSRITARFDKARTQGRAALVAYIMAGDPDLETSYRNLIALRDNGADIIEIGAPFTDPMADGPSIQRAGQRSLRAGTQLGDVLALAARFRAEDSDTPLILMGYANPVHHMGYTSFAAAAGEAGIDGVITVDLPPEEDHELREALQVRDISVIRLATPTTSDKRLQIVADGASGFVYFVSVTGVTGAGAARPAEIASKIARAREVAGLPVAVGFGVRTGDQAAEMAEIADGVVVGSAFVDHNGEAAVTGDFEAAPKKIGALAKELSEAIAKARRA
jgi:tryptophan synthase alpha chain